VRSVTRFVLCFAQLFANLAIAREGSANQNSASILPSDADIREMLVARVDGLAGKEEGIGIVVGIIEPRGRRIVAYGHLNNAGTRKFDGNTVFEIGSVTKVFTALLLADMVRGGEVALNDPVAKYLPAGVRVPMRNGRAITLLDLATHTSALPLMPDDLPAFDDSNTKFSTKDLCHFLANYNLKRDIGVDVEYSNIGYWLLGEALASRAGTDFEDLLQKRVIMPLNLHSTTITLSPDLKAKRVAGHDAVLQPSPFFSAVPGYALMKAPGGLVSTANDLLTLLSVAMGYERSSLTPSMKAMLDTRRPAGKSEQALGWVILGQADSQLIIHDGGTFGYASSVAWDPKRRAGVVVLSNQVADVNDIARHLLQPSIPLGKPTATKRYEIKVEPVLLDSYAGEYEKPDEGVFVIKRDGDFLTIKVPAEWGLPKLRLHPENPQDFFATELPLRVTFQKDANEHVNGMLIHPPRGQRPISAKKN
jgi:D-alanyl-D-alanine-carboxypeptidase/D-alanyl-D-alanine-endopeptidase